LSAQTSNPTPERFWSILTIFDPLIAVIAVDVRYAEAAQPWVASITINRIDKP
jgi:hypothetical protein